MLLTKDKRIRYRAEELEALQEGHLFCLASGNMDIDGMTQAFLDALPKIERVAGQEPVGFWHVYRDGKNQAHVALRPAAPPSLSSSLSCSRPNQSGAGRRRRFHAQRKSADSPELPIPELESGLG